MSRLPADQSARDQALDPSASYIVQAPAGSGKTGLLIRRYLILLGHVRLPEEILAITFTRKATAEMRHRIVCALRLQKEDGSAEDNPEILKLARAALDNDARHGWQLTRNTSRLRIQTIDSFCSELVHRMPWSARFGAPPVIVEDASPLFTKAALRTLSHIENNDRPELARACGDLISLMDARLVDAAGQLASMLARRDQWMRLSLNHTREHIEQWWQQTINQTLETTDALFGELEKQELAGLAAFAAANLESIAGEDSPLSHCLGLQAFPPPRHAHVAQWRQIISLLVTATGDKIRSQVNKNNGFPPEHKAEKLRLVAILNQLKEDASVLPFLNRVLAMPDAEMDDIQWRNVESILTVLPIAAAELRLLFTETNQADYIELSQRAELALGDDENPTDLAMVFDHRLQHIMVDEFQDTSAGQLSLLQKLLAGWQPDDGRSAFFVGDPMQSIYRFREAEVANFLNVQAGGIADIMPRPLQLETNFRSDAAVVDWSNEAFAAVMPTHDDKVLGAVKYAAATAFWDHSPDAEVMVHPSVDGDEQQEAETIVELIRHELQRAQEPDQNIAILGRTRRSLGVIADLLNRDGMAFDAVKLQTLGERQAIQDLVALTIAILQPADRAAWLGVLRGPWCGLSLSDLTAVVNQDRNTPLIVLLADETLSRRVSADSVQRIERLLAVMQDALARSGRLPLWQIVEATWIQLGGPATVDQSDLENCQRFITMVQQLEHDGMHINDRSLSSGLEKLWATGSADARVKLMTIHGSKGLEFDTVILPGLHRTSRAGSQELIRFRHFPDRLLIAAKPSSVKGEDAAYRFLAMLEKESQHHEASRLLYVACTRARQRLHLFANAKLSSKGELLSPPANSLLSLLWPLLADRFEQAKAEITSERETTGEDNLPDETDRFPILRLPLDWQAPPVQSSVLTETAGDTTADDASAIEFDWAGEVARVCGIVVHQIFQQIDLIGWQAWKSQQPDASHRQQWRDRLLENGLPVTLLDNAVGQIERTLSHTRLDPNADWIFNPGHRHIRSEWPVTGVINQRVQHNIIDRYFQAVDDDGTTTHWVIDFKTSRHDEEKDLADFIRAERQRYAPTMEKYARIVAQLENAEIKTALYFPVLQRLEILS